MTYEENARQLSNEEGQTDTDGGDEGALVLFGREHEDGEDEFGGEEHFDDCRHVSGRVCTRGRKTKIIDVQRPRVMLVLALKVVETAMEPGNSAKTTPEAAMLPSSCAMKTRPARIQVTAPMSAIPRVTAGLKRPMRKSSVLNAGGLAS